MKNLPRRWNKDAMRCVKACCAGGGALTRAHWRPAKGHHEQRPAHTCAHDESDAGAGVGVLTILAVDDDPLVLMSAAVMIEELGHTVIEATSGAQALEILRNGARSTWSSPTNRCPR